VHRLKSVPRKVGSLFANRTNWDLTPNPLSRVLAERRTAGLPVIDLTASNPTECGFAYDRAAILAALANPASLAYEPDPRGLLTAREAVCEYYAARSDRVPPENIILTTSTSEAYSHVFRLLCNPGDEILVPQPSYPLFDFLADLHDVRLVRYPLLYDHGWQIDFHALQQAITPRTRGVIVVNPNNPTGNFCKAREMAQDKDRYYYADQYGNQANWKAHYKGTANEIWQQTKGQVTHFVAGLGTSGTFMGVTRRLKELNPNIECIAMQPDSPFHGLEGLKYMATAIVPPIYDAGVADRHVEQSTEGAYEMAKYLGRNEGLLLGISAAAAVAASLKIGEEEAAAGRSAVIVTILCDSADKYLSERFWEQ